jgi:diguanylate cyclase (GGDEF)-like protein
MRLPTLFLACFATASVPALGWSVWTAATAWTDWSKAEAAVHAALAMGDALHVVEALSIERGALQEAALSQSPAVKELADTARRNDALLNRTQQSLRNARLPEQAVTKARDILAAARARVAEAIHRPLSERDPELVPAIMKQLYERLDAVEAAVALAQGRTAQGSASVGSLVAVAGLAVDMRAVAGRRSSHISGWVGGRRLSPAQLEEMLHLTGQLQHAWTQLQRQVRVLGNPPRLAIAISQTDDGFFRQAEPVYQNLIAIARNGGPPPQSLAEWRRWTVAALPGTLPARDAAIDEAVSVGRQLANDARTRLAIAVTATLAAFLLAAGALLILLRRLVLPIQHLTSVIVRLAGGDVETQVPGICRPDEIGAMAAAVEVFRQNALTLGNTNLRFSTALDNMSHGLAMFDAQERFVVANARLCEIFGIPAERLRPGMSFRDVLAVRVACGHFPGLSVDDVYGERGRLMAHEGPVAFDEQCGGRILTLASRPMSDGGCVVTVEDITERRQAEARIAHMAQHDALTGLPNRTLFRDRLAGALARAQRGESSAVLCLDLDRFKVVNDTLGHPVGDALLKQVAARLQAELRDTDTVARFGGDEFAVLQTTGQQPGSASALARRLIEVLGTPYEVSGHQVVIGASIGIALISADSADPDELLKDADLALYRAKADGRAAWRFFEPEMDAHMQARRLLEMDLRRALKAGEFELNYQPLVNLHTGKLAGFEALLRWRHPERGLVPPADFVPLAEEIGLIVPIGKWVLQTACAEAASWPKALKLAVNLSAAQFQVSAALVQTVSDALSASGLAADQLELEITESIMLQDTEETLATLHRLRRLGVGISMDDFGTGYSSLSYLRLFPFTKLKIDRSFIQDLGGAPGNCAAIVRAIISLSGSLGMVTTAEGVETTAQLNRLALEGCDQVQGYLFSKPVPASELSALMARPSMQPPVSPT